MKPVQLQSIYNILDNITPRSQWDKGVKSYIYEILDTLEECGITEINDENVKGMHALLLNGATSWRQYSRGGCSSVWNEEIARKLCTPSEIKRRTNKAGQLSNMANSLESWLDVQARALFQAERQLILYINTLANA